MAALAQELEEAPALPQDGLHFLLRLRDRMKEQLMEYGTAVHDVPLSFANQENVPDDVTEEKRIQSAIQDLRTDVEETKLSFQNKTLALQRIQMMDALRNKINQDSDEDSRLILEMMERIGLLSRTIIEYQQRAHHKEQQLIDTRRQRLLLSKEREEKLQVQTMMKSQEEQQASVNVTEREKMLDKIEKERQTIAIIQNVFQHIIIGSRVNWAEDPSLKAIVLHLEKNV